MIKLAAALAASVVSLALGQVPAPSRAGGDRKPEAIALWPGGAPGATGKTEKDIPQVIVYLPPADKANGAAVVICPGGGYAGLAMNHEGHQIAQWLNQHGAAGIILKYRFAPYRHPIPLEDAQRALRYTRAHAKEWRIDPQRLGILGFSAGGHLASTAGTHYDSGNKDATDPIDRLSSRPDFMVLLYPVITLTGPSAHTGSRHNLITKDADAKLIESLCNDRQVTKDTPPAFLVHTSEDTVVPPENSVLFYSALTKHRIPAELHLYEKGRHGLGLGPADLPFSSWPDRCLAWLRGRGVWNGPSLPK
ncbi:MAG: alpha/beta hydrolase [Planctomycetes bacterium]|nr:alpha/beta hydrolase [Planctomycetota bacterium]